MLCRRWRRRHRWLESGIESVSLRVNTRSRVGAFRSPRKNISTSPLRASPPRRHPSYCQTLHVFPLLSGGSAPDNTAFLGTGARFRESPTFGRRSFQRRTSYQHLARPATTPRARTAETGRKAFSCRLIARSRSSSTVGIRTVLNAFLFPRS